MVRLIDLYVENTGKFAVDFVLYLEKIGKEPLVDDEHFKGLLIRSAREDQVMHDTQDQFFDDVDWMPAKGWFERNKFTFPLSMLVIYDSYIDLGSIPMFLRKRFIARKPL